MNVVSCGVVIKVEDKFLVCHPTGHKWSRAWSIPKGVMDPGEDYKTTACRETFEETGITLNPAQLIFCGKELYSAKFNKDLVIFETTLQNKPSNLKCTSMFTPEGSKIQKPEVDKFAWITYAKAVEYLNPNLFRLFSKFVKEF